MSTTYYVETVRPPFPSKVRLDFNVHKSADFSIDCLSPSMTAVFRVDNVTGPTEAVSCIIERLAGFSPAVQLVYGGKKTAEAA